MDEMQLAAVLDSDNLLPRLLLSVANPLNCPYGVLGDQWLRIRCRAFQCWKVRWTSDIPEGDAHIA
jgi:hypothetical protein